MLHCRILSKASLVLSLLILLGLGYIFEERSDASSDICTLKSVKGAFGATFTGTITPGGAAPPGPFAAVARIVCDGKGTCHGEGTQSLNGQILPFVDLRTSYTVHPDCTGSIMVDLVGGQTINFNFIIVNRGKELRSIQTDAGTVITGNLRQQ